MKTNGIGALILYAMLIMACGEVNKPEDGGKTPGNEGGPCSSSGSCNPGLTCLSNLCVRVLDSGISDSTKDAPGTDLVSPDSFPYDQYTSDAPITDAAPKDIINPDVSAADLATMDIPLKDAQAADIAVPDQTMFDISVSDLQFQTRTSPISPFLITQFPTNSLLINCNPINSRQICRQFKSSLMTHFRISMQVRFPNLASKSTFPQKALFN